MTILLLLLTLTIVLLAQWYLARKSERIAAAARAAEASGDFYYHPGHTWVSVHGKALATAGATDLAANFVGQLASIELPPQGARLQQGQPAWTLVSHKGRRLSQAMPIAGKVVAVNRDLQRDPALAQRSPHGAGWLLRIRPTRLGKSIRNLLTPTAAKSWLDSTRAQITGRVDPALGLVAQDGGELSTGFGDHLSDSDWNTLRDELFAAAAAPPDRS
jgi:glycine cleavage system H lipoate-binding protein